MTTISNQVTMLKNQSAYNTASSETTSTGTDATDKDMFLKLMLKQMEYQDPTEPTSNEEWLSQLAQYSSLEAAQNTNSSLANLNSTIMSLVENMNTANGINQTLTLLGKEVTLVNPENSEESIAGIVSEASFDKGVGVVKVDGKEYPISYIKSVKNPE